MENKQNTKVYMVCVKNESNKKIYDVKVFDYNFRTNTDLSYSGINHSKESYEELLRHKIICNEQVVCIRVVKVGESVGKCGKVKITHERRFPDSLIVSKALEVHENKENFHSDYMDEQGVLDKNGEWVPFQFDNYLSLIISEIKPYTKIELHFYVQKETVNPIDFMKEIEKEVVECIDIVYDDLNKNRTTRTFDVEQEIEDKLVEMRKEKQAEMKSKSEDESTNVIEAKTENGVAVFFNERGELVRKPMDLSNLSFGGVKPISELYLDNESKNKK